MCLEAKEQVHLCKRKKKEGPASWLPFGLFVGICFCLHSRVAVIISKGLGVGEEMEGMRKHVPEPK